MATPAAIGVRSAAAVGVQRRRRLATGPGPHLALPLRDPGKLEACAMRTHVAVWIDHKEARIFDVEPGNYQLTVTLYELPTGQNYNWNNLATLNKQITIPEGSADEIVDLGKSELKMTNPIPTQAAGGVSVFQVTPTLPQPAK